jgi:hypothetical protein
MIQNGISADMSWREALSTGEELKYVLLSISLHIRTHSNKEK